jgi:WD40 repeat protein
VNEGIKMRYLKYYRFLLLFNMLMVLILLFQTTGIVLAAEDKNIFQKVWSGMTGNKILKLINEKKDRDSEAIAWSPDGKQISVTGEFFGTTLWNFPEMTVRYNLKNTDSNGNSKTFSPDGQHVTFSPDGQYFTSGMKIINIWKTSIGTLYKTLIAPFITPGKPQPDEIKGMNFSPDGKILVAAFGGSRKNKDSIVAFNVEDGKILWTHEPEGLMGRKTIITTSVVFSPDGSIVFLGTYDVGGFNTDLKDISRILYLDAKTGQMVRSIDEIHTEEARALAVSRDGKLLATGTSTGDKGATQNLITHKWVSYDNKDPVRVWDIETGKLIKELPVESHVWSLAFSKDGRYLFGAKSDMHKHMGLRVWDIKSGEVVQEVECDPNPMSLSVSSDGRHLAAACQSKICIYEIKTDK